VSTEYYTGLPFEGAKELLRSKLSGVFEFRDPGRSRYIPECCAFLLWHIDSGQALWGLKETRESKPSMYDGVRPPKDTLIFEAFGRTNPHLFLPWIEKTLGIRVISELGLLWELDS
jgi:hypothetical protein